LFVFEASKGNLLFVFITTCEWEEYNVITIGNGFFFQNFDEGIFDNTALYEEEFCGSRFEMMEI